MPSKDLLNLVGAWEGYRVISVTVSPPRAMRPKPFECGWSLIPVSHRSAPSGDGGQRLVTARGGEFSRLSPEFSRG